MLFLFVYQDPCGHTSTSQLRNKGKWAPRNARCLADSNTVQSWSSLSVTVLVPLLPLSPFPFVKIGAVVFVTSPPPSLPSSRLVWSSLSFAPHYPSSSSSSSSSFSPTHPPTHPPPPAPTPFPPPCYVILAPCSCRYTRLPSRFLSSPLAPRP